MTWKNSVCEGVTEEIESISRELSRGAFVTGRALGLRRRRTSHATDTRICSQKPDFDA
jgi:hypothetical protein